MLILLVSKFIICDYSEMFKKNLLRGNQEDQWLTHCSNNLKARLLWNDRSAAIIYILLSLKLNYIYIYI